MAVGLAEGAIVYADKSHGANRVRKSFKLALGHGLWTWDLDPFSNHSTIGEIFFSLVLLRVRRRENIEKTVIQPVPGHRVLGRSILSADVHVKLGIRSCRPILQ